MRNLKVAITEIVSTVIAVSSLGNPGLLPFAISAATAKELSKGFSSSEKTPKQRLYEIIKESVQQALDDRQANFEIHRDCRYAVINELFSLENSLMYLKSDNQEEDLKDKFTEIIRRYERESDITPDMMQAIIDKIVLNISGGITDDVRTLALKTYIEINKNSKETKENSEKLEKIIDILTKQLLNPPSQEKWLFIVAKEASIGVTPHFTGRDELMADIIEKIENKKKLMLVSGMGGIGKTHLALKVYDYYLEKREEEGIGALPFQHMAFFTYSEGTSFSQLFYFGLGLDKEVPPEPDMDWEYQKTWRIMREFCDKGLLLFIDNISPNIKRSELEELHRLDCTIVVTSRRIEIKGFERIQVDRLPIDDCVIMFRRINDRVQDLEEETLRGILDGRADRHTLTIDRLAHISRNKGWKMDKLEAKLNEFGFNISYSDEGNMENLLEEHAKLYAMDGVTVGEQNVLQGLAWLPDREIPAQLCNEWLAEDTRRFAEEEIEDILYNLYHKGWIERIWIEERNELFYRLHTVYAELLNKKYPSGLQEHIHLVKAVTGALKYDEKTVFTEVLAYIDYGKSLLKKVEDEEHEVVAGLISALAVISYEQEEYAQALEWNEKALIIREKVLGLDHPHTATTYNNKAVAYNKQGDYTKALEWFKKALAIREKVLGAVHPHTAATYNDIALVYKDQGNYAQALGWNKKALAIREKVLGSEHPDTASTYNNMAMVYNNQGDYVQALEWHGKALAIREKVLGPEHPDTANTYNNIATFYHSQMNYTQALEWYKKALAIWEKVLGLKHSNTATTYNNMAMIYHDQGDYVQALEWYENVLNILEKTLGSEHPHTASTYNNMASVYRSQGNYAQALVWYKKALAIAEKVMGPEHPNIASTYSNIAGVYKVQGNYVKALEWYKNALAILEKVLGPEHPNTATIYNNMANAYVYQGDYAKAIEWIEKALAVQKKVLGPEHPATANTYNTLASVYHSQGDYLKALEWYLKSYRVMKKLGEDHPSTKTVYENMKATFESSGQARDFSDWLKRNI